ncbi:hypothetical protein DFR79_102228 [Halanaerobium saccharolyticum]|uniref:Serine aminopeptidase S33 domain-containing protein n=1 Tax=Halanaerobium saccharolyticum TaxID=43595 RepID=A0A4R6M4H7_9FIRM|nr:alpha/beta fold hydrolase [Halanaerobium saccharolyticum]TDO94849.1 hypothetical protein DFR79_102228 [Halanaerobium saccharolyticum]
MYSYGEKVIKINQNGRQIHGVLYLPKRESKSPLVIFSHGYNGSNEDFRMNSEYLAARGIAAYSFDFCGGSVNSKSDLKTTEMTLFTEKEDLCAVINHFQGREKIDQNNIFLFGGSQGGLVSALTAEERREDIKGLLLLFPAFCIADNWNQKFPDSEDIPETHEFWGMRLGRKFFETIQGYDVYKNIGKYNKNVQIFVGDQDSIATAASCKKASKLYSDVELEIFDGEGHGFSEAGNRKVAEMTYQFVEHNSGS